MIIRLTYYIILSLIFTKREKSSTMISLIPLELRCYVKLIVNEHANAKSYFRVQLRSQPFWDNPPRPFFNYILLPMYLFYNAIVMTLSMLGNFWGNLTYYFFITNWFKTLIFISRYLDSYLRIYILRWIARICCGNIYCITTPPCFTFMHPYIGMVKSPLFCKHKFKRLLIF